MSHSTLHADATPEVLAKVLEEWATAQGDSESETTVTYSRSQKVLRVWSDYDDPPESICWPADLFLKARKSPPALHPCQEPSPNLAGPNTGGVSRYFRRVR